MAQHKDFYQHKDRCGADCLIHSSTMHLVYSPDEDIHYWERFSDWKVSQGFTYADDAIDAAKNGTIIWED